VDAVGDVLKGPHYLQSTSTSRHRQQERIMEAAQADSEPEWLESVENPAWYDTQPAATNADITARELKEHLINFSRLRNFLAHPNTHFSLERYNSRFQDADRLVEKLGNEQLLRRIQKIRQGWRREAKQTLAEIEARETLAELPCAYDGDDRMWKYKHELLFRRVRCFPERLRNECFPPAAARAAETWARVTGAT
jgi:hypothetical protein